MRSDVLSDWLARSDWAKWGRRAMTGDASARRYERLSGPNGNSVILMDAPPDVCGSQKAFVDIARHLSNLGLAAPMVLEWDETLGLMILEDLGEVTFAMHLLRAHKDESALYSAAVDVLIAMQSAPPPNGLTVMTSNVAAGMVDIAFEWAAKDKSLNLASEIKSTITMLMEQIDPSPSTLSLRDFHAENLIWRPAQSGLSRVGLLDFQDAFITHPAYDLASLLRDARRDVDPGLLDGLIRQMAGQETQAFKFAFHVLAVQRNLRILGIFQRLARQNQKTAYLDLLPRVWHHIETDLAEPGLRALAPLVYRAFGR